MLFYLESLIPNWSKAPLSLSFTSLWILFVLQREDVSSAITNGPLNTTAFVGQRFELNCIANKSRRQWIDWKFIQNIRLNYSDYSRQCTPNIKTPNDIDKNCIEISSSGIFSESEKNRYRVSNIANETIYSSTLSVEVVDLSYAGVYQCVDASSSTEYAFLTVIDPNTNCTVTSNSFAFNCNFAYSGFTPNLRWSSINSNSTNDCTQEEFNIVCIIQFPSFQQKEIISCHLDEKISDATSSESVIFQIAVISGVVVVVVVIIAVVLLRKRAVTEPEQSSAQPNEETQQNDGYELIEVTADISPSAEYASLQQNFALESPVYTDLQTVSSSDRKDKFSSKDKDKFNITDYENIS